MSFPLEQIDNSPFLRAPIAVSSSGANNVLAAVTGKYYRIIAYTILVDSTVAITFKSGSTSLSGAMNVTAGIAQPEVLTGCMQTAVGEAFVMTLGGAVGVNGYVVYQLIG